MDNTMTARIDQLFAVWQDGICPGGQVVVRRKGELIYDKCFGYANVENKLKVTDDTVFHVASVSKQLTVMAVLLLHEDGKLNVDDDIRKYIPELVRFPQAVTVRQLMNNVSGIRDIWTLQMMRGVRIDDTITQPDAVKIISEQRALNFEPGTKYMYSNSNFVYLAEIAEKVSGLSLNDFLKKRVFEPLGMTSTCVRDRYWQLIPNRAVSYLDTGETYVHNVLNYGSYGSTSLHTTAKDFLKWMETYKNPKICKPETLKLMFETPTLADGTKSIYAGGLMVGELAGHKYVQHGGADAAFRSFIISFYEDDMEIVVISNTQNLPPDGAAMAIANIVYGIDTPEADAPAAFTESFDEKDAPGFYYSAPYEIMSVQVYESGGQLYLRQGYEPCRLTRVKGNEYRAGRNKMRLFLGRESGGMCMGKMNLTLRKADTAKECPDELAAFVGCYESAEIETAYRVVLEDGALYLDHYRNGRARLYRHERDVYIAADRYAYAIRFTRGSGHRVIGFTIDSGRVQGIAFSKTE